MIQELAEDYPIATLCTLLDCPRSSYYYEAVPHDEAALWTAIEQIVIRWPFYGYRRITAQLRRSYGPVNSKVVRRLLQQFGHTGRIGRVRLATTDSTHGLPRYPNLLPTLVVDAPDVAWCADITYIRLGDRFIFLAVILDAYTRAVRGWSVGRGLGAELALGALQMALQQHRPHVHHSDQGVQYAAQDYVTALQTAGVQISMAAVGQPTQNGLAERFMRTLKEEHVDYTEYADFADAHRQLKQWLEVEYNQERIHSALAYATPTEFETAYWTTKSPGLTME